MNTPSLSFGICPHCNWCSTFLFTEHNFQPQWVLSDQKKTVLAREWYGPSTVKIFVFYVCMSSKLQKKILKDWDLPLIIKAKGEQSFSWISEHFSLICTEKFSTGKRIINAFSVGFFFFLITFSSYCIRLTKFTSTACYYTMYLQITPERNFTLNVYAHV